MQRIFRALTIAGSDSGGCAGIQADLKTFAALGVHGTCAITAVTSQDTQDVHAVFEIPPETVGLQIDSVLADIGADAVKTGMLASSAIIRLVAERMRAHSIRQLVVDPVMTSAGGDPLLHKDALPTLKSELFPLARIVTPNLSEAETLAEMRIESVEGMEEAARRIHALGAPAVVVKGGHLPATVEATDFFFDGRRGQRLTARRIATLHTHGGGCTFSAAIAAGLAQGHSLADAVGRAKAFVHQSLMASYPIGHGRGPLGQWRVNEQTNKR